MFFVVSLAYCSSAEGKRAKTGPLSSHNDKFTQSSTVGEGTRNYVSTFRKNRYGFSLRYELRAQILGRIKGQILSSSIYKVDLKMCGCTNH